MKNRALLIDLGFLDYKKALDLQVQTLQSKIKGTILRDRVFFVEHPSVYTLGKRGGRENLGVSELFLTQKGIDVVETDRGGNITYHGPGQAVLYPVVDLKKAGISVKDFVHGLEGIMKKTAFEFGIDAQRDSKNHGLWVQNAKIGSVGISIKRGISFHGLAMNISPDLTPFSWINPCGLENISMTSLAAEIKKKHIFEGSKTRDIPSMERIKSAFITHFSSLFHYSIEEGNFKSDFKIDIKDNNKRNEN